MIINAIMDDHALLREYTEQASEKAFSELVERHLPLVYGTALRILRDPHAAQDVAQSVFLQLARKAWTVREGRALPGWLYRCTQRAAYMAMRTEQRRYRRETEAMNLAELDQNPAVAWEHIAPLLDEALARLSRAEQDAVLLRFFQEKSYREVGQVCGLNESAARKRVERSLEKIRLHFASRGMTATAALLATAIAAHASPSPPTGLAVRVASTSLAGTAGVGSFAFVFSRIVQFLTSAKVLGTAAVVAGLVSLPLLYQNRENARVRENLAVATKQESQLRQELATANTLLREEQKLASQQAQDLTPPLGSAVTVAASPPFDLAAIAKLNFPTIDSKNYTLTPEAITLLAITPDEAARVQAVIEQLKAQVQQHGQKMIQRIPVDSLQGPNFIAFFKNHPGDQSLYLIPPIDDDEAKAMADTLSQNVENILGAERAGILIQRASAAFAEWVTSKQGMVVAFADRNSSDDEISPDTGASGPNIRTAWMIKRTVDGKFVFTRGVGKKAVPAQLSYLFAPTPDGGSSSPLILETPVDGPQN